MATGSQSYFCGRHWRSGSGVRAAGYHGVHGGRLHGVSAVRGEAGGAVHGRAPDVRINVRAAGPPWASSRRGPGGRDGHGGPAGVAPGPKNWWAQLCADGIA